MDEEFSRVIGEWCTAAGIACPPSAPMHFDMAGTVVAFVHEPERAPDALYILCDLGAFDFPDLHRHLLRQNGLFETEMDGYFALHPQSGNVVYRTRVPLDARTHGRELLASLPGFIDAGRQRLAGEGEEHWRHA